MTNNDLDFSLDYFLSESTKNSDFTDDSGDSGYDTLLTTVTEDHDDVVGIIKATSPVGVMYGQTAYDAFDFSTPDIDGSASAWTKEDVELDTDSDTDNVVNGDYTWDYRVRVGNIGGAFVLGSAGLQGYSATYFEVVCDDYATLLGATPTGLSFQVYSSSGVTGNEGTYTITGLAYVSGTGTLQVTVSETVTPFTPGLGDTDLCGIVFTKSETLEYCFDTDPETDIEVTSDCVCSELTSVDNSNYETSCNGVSLSPNLPISRSHKIYYPKGIFPTARPIVAVSIASSYFEIAGNPAGDIPGFPGPKLFHAGS